MLKKRLKVDKQVKSEVIRDINEDTNQVKKFIIILVCVALIAGLLYFLTAKYLIKDNFQDETNTSSDVTIAYDNIRAGNLFNRPYDKYYVFAYDPTSTKSGYYAALLYNFANGDDKIYFLDLSLEINKNYIGEKSNPKASDASELSLTDPTLILIEDGKIKKYYDDEESIIEVLG